MGTDMDILVCENTIMYKNDQDKKLLKDYKNKYELD
jgi:carbamoyltransferase